MGRKKAVEMTTEKQSKNKLEHPPKNGFRIVTNHIRYWFVLLNVLAIILFIGKAVWDAILPLLNIQQSFTVQGYFFTIGLSLLVLNVVYFILTGASEVFIIQPTFFTGKTSENGTTKVYSFILEPYSIDKPYFNALIQKVVIKPRALLKFCSAEKEDGSPICFDTNNGNEGEQLIIIKINREIRRGFFLKFSLMPEKGLDDIEDIDRFEKSLSIEISIFYKKLHFTFEQRKEIP